MNTETFYVVEYRKEEYEIPIVDSCLLCYILKYSF